MYTVYGAASVTALIMEVPAGTGNEIVHRNPEKERVSGNRHFSKPGWPSSRQAGGEEQLTLRVRAWPFSCLFIDLPELHLANEVTLQMLRRCLAKFSSRLSVYPAPVPEAGAVES